MGPVHCSLGPGERAWPEPARQGHRGPPWARAGPRNKRADWQLARDDFYLAISEGRQLTKTPSSRPPARTGALEQTLTHDLGSLTPSGLRLRGRAMLSCFFLPQRSWNTWGIKVPRMGSG